MKLFDWLSSNATMADDDGAEEDVADIGEEAADNNVETFREAAE
ncbi:hypothetical protein GA0061103_0850 [Rhizobium multihospitium]|uniref:Uncharacterized protein n=1 Tax=Rhizobium multihospitium TaxID=410764 RepID=A0A1C3XE16_9HYPH|nr:hypothetical protein GA0061103_0850 [Rhizobium multihospitium]